MPRIACSRSSWRKLFLVFAAVRCLAPAISFVASGISGPPRVHPRGHDFAGGTAIRENRETGLKAEVGSSPEMLESIKASVEGFNWTKLAIELACALIPAVLFDFASMPFAKNVFKAIGLDDGEDDGPVPRKYLVGHNHILQQRPFDFNRWDDHRKNPQRYFSTTVSMLTNSTMVRRLKGPLFFLNVISATVLFYNTYCVPHGWPEASLPSLPFTISSSALGLLLVFRVNGANNRYVKSRGMWGDILNILRDLNQQATGWSKNPEAAIEFCRWLPVFSSALMCHLRGPHAHDLETELVRAAGPEETAVGDGAGLSKADIAKIMGRPKEYNPAHYVLDILRRKVKTLELDDQERLLVEANITRLINNLGGCENVFATPIPVGYTKHTTRFLLLWLSLLPLVLEGSLGVGTIFGEQLLAFGLLGIEDVGIQLEEPFAVLPLERICMKISLESQALRRNVQSFEKDAKSDLMKDQPLSLMPEEISA